MPVGENFDQAGLYLVLGATRARGLRLQRERIRTSLIRVDPITSTLRNSGRVVRRTCPNALWRALILMPLANFV